MKVVLTLVVRDEADIVEEQIRYHLACGVDVVVATDHGSADGTTEILRGFERSGRLHLIRKDEEGFRQGEWATEMARFAAAELSADWIVHADADEFWWPRYGSLRDVLAAVPANFGVVRGLWRHFALRSETDEPFYERMTIRRRPDVDRSSPYNVQVKVAHRADTGVTISRGSHDAWSDRLPLIREWFPFEVLHFPIRTRAQLMQKYLTAAAYQAGSYPRVPRHTAAMAARLSEDSEEVYKSFVVGDADVERGIAGGNLVVDTRLREVLRGGAPEQPLTLADDVAFAQEIDAFLETDAARRLGPRVDALARRIEAIETRRSRLTAR